MPPTALAHNVEAIRRFNRFYTKRIGVLTDGYLSTALSLTEARVIYELAQREVATASELGAELGLDAGYLSRMVRGFKKQGLLDKQPSPTDRRQSILRLTSAGQAIFATLDARSRADFEQILASVAPGQQRRLVAAMQTIEGILGPQPARGQPYLLRPHRPGDMGWVVHRHAALYTQEYGWDEQFEGLVAGIVAEFIQRYDHKRERCWMAEMNGEIVGSVFLVKKSETVAKLRLLLVEPHARGHGIGARLVGECVDFARRAGYTTLTLWTNSILTAARRIYEQAGFRLVESEAHHSFGHDLVGETWELGL